MIEEWKVYKDSRITNVILKNGQLKRSGSGALWEVSNLGRVKKNGKLFELKREKSGKLKYYTFARIYVHRAVAELFIPNPDNKPQVDHIDTNTYNNRVDNLRWVTQSENNKNPITHKKMIDNRPNFKGENNPFYGKKHDKKTIEGIRLKRLGKTPPNKGHLGELYRVYDNDEHTKWHMEKYAS